MSKFNTNQNPEAPTGRSGAVGPIKFKPKSYGIEAIDFNELQPDDHFHFYFNHLPQNQVYKVTELQIHGIRVELVLGVGNTTCPFLGYGADRRSHNFSPHEPYIGGVVSRPSAPVLVIKIKHPKK